MPERVGLNWALNIAVSCTYRVRGDKPLTTSLAGPQVLKQRRERRVCAMQISDVSKPVPDWSIVRIACHRRWGRDLSLPPKCRQYLGTQEKEWMDGHCARDVSLTWQVTVWKKIWPLRFRPLAITKSLPDIHALLYLCLYLDIALLIYFLYCFYFLTFRRLDNSNRKFYWLFV